ncbi:MAG: EF-P lysine aminoacylase EpmA [Desulfobulbales bacterium]|nr:EF-P lysine aminoacylase EpmA [Desulfobulbales bacterium]
MLNEPGLRQRAELIQAIRGFFVDRGYIEVDTPVRLPTIIPEAHNEPVESGDYFLQTSPEICMKRLLAQSGCSRIFQICRCFRKNERGDIHLPEFTMLEWYRTRCDYRSLMDECEDMIISVARASGHKGLVPVKGYDVNLEKPWVRLTVSDAFQQYAPVSMDQALAQGVFDEILCSYIEPQLGTNKPVFLYDYPVALGALARRRNDNPSLAERFEVYIAGLELANGFSELTDQPEQQERFETELRLIKKQGRPATELPQKFLAALAEMQDTAGIALGVDRLAMVMHAAEAIDQVVSFSPEDL